MNELKAYQILELVRCLSTSEFKKFKILMKDYKISITNFKKEVIIDEKEIDNYLLRKVFNYKI